MKWLSVVFARSFSILIFLTLLLASFLSGDGFPNAPGALPIAAGKAVLGVNPDFGAMPLYFIANQGQLDQQVAFTVEGQDRAIYFTPGGLTYALRDGERGWSLKLDFSGARAVHPLGENPTPARISYFKGDRSQWHTALPTYQQIIYPELYPGIDLVYQGTQTQLKYSFLVEPGADPAQIRLAYRGADLILNEQGQLEVSTPLGGFTDDAPTAYQEIAGDRRAVPAAFRLQDNTASFELGTYDRSLALVIDPVSFVYSGYIGGWGDEEGLDIAVDAAGAAYIAGYTYSDFQSFPITVGPSLTHSGGNDAFIAKVQPDGSGLIYCGYIGGSSYDQANAVAVDAAGNAYLTGYTQSTADTFPVTVGPDLSQNGSIEAFVAKVNTLGTGLDYAGFIGGSAQDYGYGIAVDASGRAYVGGYTYSSEASFPVSLGPDLTYGGNDIEDGFIARVNPSGSALEYAGYIGGMYADRSFGVAVDSSNRAYVAGFSISTSTDFPKVIGPDLTHNGGYDATISRIAADGLSFEYSGYIGGNASEYGGINIAVDATGRAIVVGGTSSREATFPVKIGPDLTFNSTNYEYDTFIAGVKSDGTELEFAGYIGGALDELPNSIAIGPNGDYYVSGYTTSDETSFPVLIGPDLTYNGNYDAFVTRVKADATGLVYSGYIGGDDIDLATGVAVGPDGDAYVTGRAQSYEDTFPVLVGPALAHSLYGAYEVFVSRISLTLDVNPLTLPGGTVGAAFSQVFTASGGTPPYAFELTGTLPAGMSFSGDTLSGTPTQSGDFPIEIEATDSLSVSGERAYTLSIAKGSTTTALSSSLNPSTYGESVQFTAVVSGGGGTPTGTVQFKDGGVNLGSPVALVSGSASLATAALAVGTHPITAEYSGDGNYLASSGTLAPDQAVGKALSTTAVYSSLNPSTYGASVQFSAHVTGAAGTPQGGVQFRDNGVAIGIPAALNISGWAYLNTSTLTVGTHIITADYTGDTIYLASSGTLAPSQVVNRALPNVTIGSSLTPSVYGQSVTFTVHVTSPVGTPTGNVEFLDGSSSLGDPVPLVGDTATLTTNTLGPADHFITATYTGDSNFQPRSANMHQIVNKAATTTTVISSPNPSELGETVTFTATVTSPAGTPNLYVQFKDGGVNLGAAVELVNGVGHSSTSALTEGTHIISAEYLGSPYYLTSSGILPGGQVVQTATNPIPAITSLEPSGVAVGSAEFMLTVNGTGFIPGSQVVMTGDDLPTTYISANQLTATVWAGKVDNLGAFPITVTNPAPGGGTSAEAFLFTSESGALVSDYDLATNSDPAGTAIASTGTLTATASGTGSVLVAIYSSNPGGALTFTASGSYLDVSLDPGNAFTAVTIEACDLGGGSQVYWWDGAVWVLVSPQSFDPLSGCVTMDLDGSSSPSLAELVGTPFAASGMSIYLPVIRR